LNDFNFLLAEDAFADISDNTPFCFRNIAEFEHLLSEVVDCIVIFPESPGSFAELGFFAHSDARLLTLVVNPLHLQGEESFINAGAIDYINKDSNFRPQVHIQFDRNSTPDFSPVVDRLERRLKKTNRKKIELAPAAEMPSQLVMYLLTYLVSTCKVVHVADLKFLFFELLNEGAEVVAFDEIVSFSLAANLVARVGSGGEYLVSTSRKNPFIEVDSGAVSEATLSCIQFYQKHFPDVLNLLRERP